MKKTKEFERVICIEKEIKSFVYLFFVENRFERLLEVVEEFAKYIKCIVFL